MALNKEYNNIGYVIGRITAIVSKMVATPSTLVADVAINPLQKLAYYYVEACKRQDDPLYDELMQVSKLLLVDKFPAQLPAEEAGRMWIGYYNQLSELERYTTRIRIGQQLADARIKKGLTIRDLAEISGLNHANISKLEKGRYNASVDIIERLAHCLGIELNLTTP